MPKRLPPTSRLRRLLGCVATTALIGTAAPAFALCGNTILDAGEQCDSTAAGGDAACPGACVHAGLSDQCTCAHAATDRRSYVVAAGTQVRLGGGTLVGSGNLGVTQPHGSVKIGRDAKMPQGSQVVADGATVLGGATIGRLFANTFFVHPDATIAGGGPFPVTLPLVLTPALGPFPVSHGTQAIDVAPGGVRALAPGAYDAVVLGPGATLVLNGLSSGGAGVYDMRALVVMAGGRVVANNPVLVHIDERLGFSRGGASGNSFIGPATPAHLVAGDVQLIADRSARLGQGAIVNAHIRAPTIQVGSRAVFSGRLTGEKISIGRDAALFREGGCGDGFLDAGEECDTSASGGDAACPGHCIAGDPQGQGRITLGQPGQCTCSCNADSDCDDHNACNGHETCQNHVCVLGIPPDCNDHNPCTRDCNPAVGCVNTPVANGTSCNDSNACTSGDSCQNGSCAPGAPVPDGTSCSDGNRCTVSDTCRSGSCVAGPARDCTDDNTCTVDTCDTIAGCLHAVMQNGDPCSDANVCTLADTCQNGTCIGGPPRNCDDGNPCTADACDATTGCHHSQLADGVACGTGKTCQGGVCS